MLHQAAEGGGGKPIIDIDHVTSCCSVSDPDRDVSKALETILAA